MNYLICGSVVMDNILGHNGSFKDSILPDKINNLNVSFDLEEIRHERGGTGANILYNALQIPLKDTEKAITPYLFTYVGLDYDNYYKLHFPKENIQYLQHINDKKLAACFILNANDGNQITSFYQGAMATTVDLKQFPINKFEHFLLSPDNPSNTIALSNFCLAEDKNFYFDPGQCTPLFIKYYPEEFKNILKHMHGLFVNEYEKDLIETFIGYSLEDIYQENQNLRFIVTTKGSKGFTLHTPDNKFQSGPCLKNVNVVDPTGCGDSFRAGFMKEYILTQSPYSACIQGTILASFAIESFGGQNHKINKEVYEQRQGQYYNELLQFNTNRSKKTSPH